MMKPWRVSAATFQRLMHDAPWSLLWAVIRTAEPDEFSPAAWTQYLAVGIDTGFPEAIARIAWQAVVEDLGEPGSPFDTEWPEAPNVQAWTLVCRLLWEESLTEPDGLRAVCESRVLDSTLRPPEWPPLEE